MKEMDSQSKLSLKLQAYQYLKTKILNCEYRPNEFLNEQKLCAEMGNISRTPMRDALGRLEHVRCVDKHGLNLSDVESIEAWVRIMHSRADGAHRVRAPRKRSDNRYTFREVRVS